MNVVSFIDFNLMNTIKYCEIPFENFDIIQKLMQ